MKPRHYAVSLAFVLIVAFAVSMLSGSVGSGTKQVPTDNTEATKDNQARSPAVSISPVKIPSDVTEDGFRGVKWGSGKSSLGKHKVVLSAKEGDKVVEAVDRVSEKKEYSGVALDYLRYVYVNDELLAVEMGAKGKKKFFELITVLLGKGPEGIDEVVSQEQLLYVGSIGPVTASIQFVQEDNVTRLAYISNQMLIKHGELVEDASPEGAGQGPKWQESIESLDIIEKPVCVQ